MEFTLGSAQVDPLAVYKDRRKLGEKLSRLVTQTEKAYEQFMGPEMIRNLAYWRGAFWKGDGYRTGWGSRVQNYRSERNEVFPILETIVIL